MNKYRYWFHDVETVVTESYDMYGSVATNYLCCSPNLCKCDNFMYRCLCGCTSCLSRL